MSDVVGLGRRVSALDISPQFSNYSKVIIHTDDETAIEVGDDTGRTLELTNPFATQEMAENILQSLSGYQYQPYDAQGALLDPAAEIGDAANIRGTYGGIYSRSRKFGRLMTADISAPHDEEINHEYQYESPEERKFTRQINDVKASLIIANDNIEAKVSQESPEGQTSFSWKLLSDSHRWYANGREVMSISASGLTVKGNVQATTGTIGGFNISASAIWNNISYYGGTQNSGVYVGTNGIQLGQGFFVNSSGQCVLNSLTANNATINGTLNVGGAYISADTLRSGAQSAYNNGSYWSGGAAGGYTAANVFNNNTGVAYMNAGTINARSAFYFSGRRAVWRSTTVRNASGTGTITLYYLAPT